MRMGPAGADGRGQMDVFVTGAGGQA